MELVCKVQNYDWGKPGETSKVAALVSNANSEVRIDPKQKYAELWMGTHVSGPSVIKNSKQTLADVINEHPDYLGDKVLELFGQHLPFLFKVLSVNKALSIQAHPNKKHAEELHSKFPNIYKDSNHKPEMAIALTPFEALCGFRPMAQIKKFIEEIPELKAIINYESIRTCNDLDLLKACFKKVLTCEKDAIAAAIQKLLKRQSTLSDEQKIFELSELVARLNSQFPNDVGIFMVYFMNYLRLNPSEAIYLGANEPHAYLSGDCIEAMACSDNVVRAGLTPKFIDVATLCGMLTYNCEPPQQKLYKPDVESEFSKIFKPPVADFALIEIKVPATSVKFATTARNSASILLVISGSAQFNATKLAAGSVLFIPAGLSIEIEEIGEDLHMYQCTANV